jgi:RNA recognition motif-containing protein
MKVYVGNLPFSCTEDELKALFQKYSSLISCNLVKDQETGRSRGFAFVELSSDDEATQAINDLNNKPMGSTGRLLVVNEARPRESRPSNGKERNFNRNKR